jgi:hypothetical protein
MSSIAGRAWVSHPGGREIQASPAIEAHEGLGIPTPAIGRIRERLIAKA